MHKINEILVKYFKDANDRLADAPAAGTAPSIPTEAVSKQRDGNTAVVAVDMAGTTLQNDVTVAAALGEDAASEKVELGASVYYN